MDTYRQNGTGKEGDAAANLVLKNEASRKISPKRYLENKVGAEMHFMLNLNHSADRDEDVEMQMYWIHKAHDSSSFEFPPATTPIIIHLPPSDPHLTLQ